MISRRNKSKHYLLEFESDRMESMVIRSQRIFNKLKVWRKNNIAPVDTMGAHQHSDKQQDSNEQAYQYLIGVILSIQSQDGVTDNLMKILLKDGITIDKYYNMKETDILEKIKGINFNKTKSKYIYESTKMIVDKFGGKVPDTLDNLMKLPGVGNKVANLVLSKAYDKNVGIAVDTHVHRISNRIGLVNTKTPDNTMKELNKLYEPHQYDDINTYMVGLGQLICKARDTKCLSCPLIEDCNTGMKVIKKPISSKRNTPNSTFIDGYKNILSK